MPEHVYTHGHHESVLRSHSWRTVENSAKYLVPYIKPTDTILDIGCGPGTISVDFAQNYVPQGKVIAMENVEDPLVICRQNSEKAGVSNIECQVGDIHKLPFDDDTFDIVHAHQVLQHVEDPVQAIKEMKRVTKVGGYVAARDADYEGFLWYPKLPGLNEWLDLYVKVARKNGGTPDMGCQIHAKAIQAGCVKSKLKMSSSTWCYASDEEVAWWSGLWADRTVASTFASTSKDNNLATQEDLERIRKTWQEWGACDDAWLSILNGEIIYQK